MALKEGFMKNLKPNNSAFSTSTPVGQKLENPDLQATLNKFKSTEAIKKDADSRVEMIAPDRLRAFHTRQQHPFKVMESRLNELRPSIQENGILTPCEVRIDADEKGCYEILAGHHRWKIAQELEIMVPCIINNIDDDTAIIHMYETNKQRGFSDMLPSEICEALVLKREAESNQGKRTDLQESSTEENEEQQTENSQDEKIMSTTNENRYLRLRYLIPDFMALLDDGAIALRTGVDLSFMRMDSQQNLYDYLSYNCKKLSAKQAAELRKLEAKKGLDETSIEAFFNPKKKVRRKKKYTLNTERLEKYLDVSSMTAEEIEQAVMKAVASFYSKK